MSRLGPFLLWRRARDQVYTINKPSRLDDTENESRFASSFSEIMRMSTPPSVIDCFLDRLAAKLTPAARGEFMPGIRNGLDALWACGDDDARAQQVCDELVKLVKARGQVPTLFPALFAEMTRVVETTHNHSGLPS
jgi:hypothetical protein